MPYQDSPQSIGHSATISAPHMHASACESLLDYLKPGAKVLDVGSGSGYLTHVLAELVKPGGTVVGIEHIQPLVDLANKNTAKSEEGRGLLDSGGIVYVKADGRKGWTGEGGKEGYDAIHVGAAAAGFHQELIDQLKAPGRLVSPSPQLSEPLPLMRPPSLLMDNRNWEQVLVLLETSKMFPPVLSSGLLTSFFRLFIPVEENYMQHIYVIDKEKDGSVVKKKQYGVQYVPLTDAPEV